MSPVAHAPERASRPTIYDIAQAAGVSHTTVSRALNGLDGMTDETRRRVLGIAARVGYEPNVSARVLSCGPRPRLVALVASAGHDWREPARLVEALAREARRAGFAVTLVGVDPSDEGSLSHAATRASEPGAAGTVLLGGDQLIHERLLALLHASPSRDSTAGGVGPVLALGADPGERMDAALRYVVQLGHRTIALGASEHAGHSTLGSATGGVTIRSIPADTTAEAGFRIGADITALSGCTALVAPTFSFALGAVRGIRQRGLRVPHDVSVISLEDHLDAAHAAPPITAISAPVDDLATWAVAALIDAGRGIPPSVSPPVRAHLVVRQSTAAPLGAS
ncbi:LacI family DNA-binding transcriptional regulator [Microbacterium flavescens]|jgi:DNA-binding LacI/PurR family transcriptional regulator|uniref:LacI family DNA-binding transcriptional regulator n=1 Tax=Microbacterium flavescens TaxID=69366 RepID=UPI001BDE4679|nr:LacI family DNA-binding transcriptional regulator [Microbacterium flavescens]BFF10098.1 LacI family DNA-binding transcriptional regulator [Microbacterium flavescens]